MPFLFRRKEKEEKAKEEAMRILEEGKRIMESGEERGEEIAKKEVGEGEAAKKTEARVASLIPPSEIPSVGREIKPVGEIEVKRPMEVIEKPEIRREEVEVKEERAPLFVKVERYREVLKKLKELKKELGESKRLLSVFIEAESLVSESRKSLAASLQRIERSIAELDALLLKPEWERRELAPEKASEIEQIIESLAKQIEELRKELRK